jgi:hypothetical protein
MLLKVGWIEEPAAILNTRPEDASKTVASGPLWLPKLLAQPPTRWIVSLMSISGSLYVPAAM